ncbi:hypothetical protein HDU79_010743, partial [Rhizoclosmatium sp. JEL0117]
MYSNNSSANNQRIGTYGSSQHPAPNQQGGYYVPPGPYQEPPHPPPDLFVPNPPQPYNRRYQEPAGPPTGFINPPPTSSPFNQQPPPPPTISHTDQPPAYSALPFPDIDFSIDKVEPMLLLDTTASMHLPASDSPSSQSQQLTRIQLVQKSIGILVEKLSTVDSQAEFEQDSDGEGGGLRTVTFSGGSALDLGDLNPQNLGEKFAQINWEGSTLIVPGFTKLLDVYNEEFGDFGPSSRPKMVALVITDGEAQDINDLAVMILTMDFTNVYLVFALIGFGKDYENARVRLAEL